MKHTLNGPRSWLLLVLALAGAVFSQATPAQATPGQGPGGNAAMLEQALNTMDDAAAKFQSAQAGVELDQYTKVVSETDVQTGTVYYQRQGSGITMATEITSPVPKYFLFSEGKVLLYQPRIDQVTEYNVGKDRALFQSFLVLGFGGRGHDLAKSFEVRYGGTENVGGVNAAKLELTPKSPSVLKTYNKIILWIDPARGISVQQQFLAPNGDYNLAKYNDIKLNQKLAKSVFKLKTTGKTTFVKPQG
jgi:outer membrane lipoprotein-sorting protein